MLQHKELTEGRDFTETQPAPAKGQKRSRGRLGSAKSKASETVTPAADIHELMEGRLHLGNHSMHANHQDHSGGHTSNATQGDTTPAASHSAICADIRALHRTSRFALKSQSRIDRSLEAFIRVNVFGFNPHGTEKEIEAASKGAMKLLKQIRSMETPEEFATLEPMVHASDASRGPWDAIRNDCEKRMRKLAEQLPCYELVEATAGFGALGLAQIIGETGDLSNYANVAKVWKRMGYAPHNGYAASAWRTNRADGKKLTSDEWTVVGYSPERCSIAFSLADSMFRHQITSAAKSETTYGAAKGPYGAVYIARRERTTETHPEWNKAHAHADALRVMMKALLRDLWVTWHKHGAGQRSNGSLGVNAAHA